MIHGNMVGAYSSIGKTYVFVDEEGREFAGMVVEKEEVIDATENDIREGKVAIGIDGLTTGVLAVPVYHYAILDESGLCNEVRSTSKNCDGADGYISIPIYSNDYLEKYYNSADGKWYLDNTFATEAEELN